MSTNQPQGEDVVVARLRAADPAAGSEPDLGALRAAVDARIAADGVDEVAAARRRRWTSWPARVAGAAAAALVVGSGGGFVAGMVSAGGSEATSVALPPITVQGNQPAGPGAGDADALVNAEAGGPAGGLTGVQPLRTGFAESLHLPWFGGRSVFTASGLSDERGTAPGWGFDSEGAFTEDAVRRAAEVLGVEGTPTRDDWSWTVGDTDGSGPQLMLQADALVSLEYHDPTVDPYFCDPEVLSGEGTASDGGCEERDLGKAPDAEAAVDRLRDTMRALGVDVDAYEFSAEGGDSSDEGWRYVSAAHVLDGRQTGVQWSASFTGAGLQTLYGATAELVPLGSYDVVGPAEAVERLMDPRFGPGSGGPVGWLDGRNPAVMAEPSSGASSPAGPPPTATPGADLRWPVTEVTIVDARLGGAMQYQSDGAAMILPAYELISDDGAIWTVIAVAESHLDLTSGR